MMTCARSSSAATARAHSRERWAPCCAGPAVLQTHAVLALLCCAWMGRWLATLHVVGVPPAGLRFCGGNPVTSIGHAVAVWLQTICDDTLTGFRKREETESSDGSESPQRSGPSYTRPTTASAAQGTGRGRSPVRCGAAWCMRQTQTVVCGSRGRVAALNTTPQRAGCCVLLGAATSPAPQTLTVRLPLPACRAWAPGSVRTSSSTHLASVYGGGSPGSPTGRRAASASSSPVPWDSSHGTAAQGSSSGNSPEILTLEGSSPDSARQTQEDVGVCTQVCAAGVCACVRWFWVCWGCAVDTTS